jgi:hypothetical protein
MHARLHGIGQLVRSRDGANIFVRFWVALFEGLHGVEHQRAGIGGAHGADRHRGRQNALEDLAALSRDNTTAVGLCHQVHRRIVGEV